MGGPCCPYVARRVVGPVPVSTRAEPIRAWKLADVAQVVTHNGRRLMFAGVGHSSRYDVDDVAVCGKGDRHRVPDVECSCGFWALFDRDTAVGAGMSAYGPARRWLLEVELYGRVVRFERGYRAERQRMLAVTVPGQCAYCLQPGRFIVDNAHRAGSPSGDQVLTAVCPSCALPVPDGARVTLAELRAALGTEVSAPMLAPDDEPLPRPAPPPERPARDQFEALSALVFSTSAIAPRELFASLMHGQIQRYDLPTVNYVNRPFLEIRTEQGSLYIRIVGAAGYVLWQCVVRAGRPGFDSTDPTSATALP